MTLPNGPTPRTNVLAIVSIVTAFMAPLAAVVTGHLALRQIARSGEEGRGLALAGLIIGYIACAGFLVFFVVWLSLVISILSRSPAFAPVPQP